MVLSVAGGVVTSICTGARVAVGVLLGCFGIGRGAGMGS